MMVLLSGLLGLAGITVFSTALALLLECAVPLLLLPVIGGSVVWLCLWGFVGLLPVGGWLFYLGAAAAGVWLVLCLKKQLLPQLAKEAGATEQLKARDPMKWVGLMNTCKAQAEEILMAELIHS